MRRTGIARTARTALVALLVAACASSSPATPSPSASPSAAPTASPTAAPGSACVAATTPAARDWNERVWYEVFVRSFADGNGDGIGDLRGLTAKLDYLNDGNPATTTDLGIGGIWLMPIAESGSYHGYDVIDYRKVEQDYGTSADFQALVAAAHQRGIKVIVDMVLNHSSNDNPWFVDAQAPGSAHDGWYVWSDTNPGYLGPGGQVVWHQQGARFYYGLFSDRMPDLNLRNPAVTAELQDVARFWLADMGVDGFRLDAVQYLIEDGPKQLANTPETHAWLAGYKAAVDAVKPDAMLVGEVWTPATNAGSYVPGSLDLDFDFPLADAYRSVLQNGSAGLLDTALDDTITAWPVNQEASFLTNHDQDRVMSQLGGDLPSAKLAAFMLMTGPGVPFVYYGEEIGMQGRKPDEQIRTPMQWTADAPAGGFSTATPWEPLADGYQAVNVAAQAGDPTSLLSTYRSLIAARTATTALRDGAITIVEPGSDPVAAWLRTTADQVLLAVVNVGDQPVTEYGLTLEPGPLCGARTARVVASVGAGTGALTPAAPDVTPGGGLHAWRPFPVLPPRSGYLLALDPAS